MARRRWAFSIGVGALVVSATTGCAWIERASVDSAGTQANGASLGVAVSADGRYIAFPSFASNLVAGDTNGTPDVFVRDTVTGTTTRVSVDSAGTQANADTTEAAISGDGRYVAFPSFASNLVAGDTNGTPDVFVRDTVAGTTTRVSVDSAGTQANGNTTEAAISGDGRYVAFASSATNLVVGDTNGTTDVFVRDTVAGTTTRVSVDSSATQANGGSVSMAISADGRYVAFRSLASNLVAGDTNGFSDVFVRDTVAGTTTRVSVDGVGTQANAESREAAISGDGRYVGFRSSASNLVAGDTNGADDVFVRDTVAGTTTRVSVLSDGTQANADSTAPAFSADGRYVAFSSSASNLVAGDTNGFLDVFVRDTVAGTTTRVSVDAVGAEANLPSLGSGFSADGRYVAFVSLASNLVAGDTNSTSDVIVRAHPQPTVTGLAPGSLARGTTTPVTVTGSGFIGGALGLSATGNGGDVTFSNVTVVSPSEITALATVAEGATVGARVLWVLLAGTGPGLGAGASGICGSCLTVT